MEPFTTKRMLITSKVIRTIETLTDELVHIMPITQLNLILRDAFNAQISIGDRVTGREIEFLDEGGYTAFIMAYTGVNQSWPT